MAKRVNTRFLIVLTAVFACLIAAGVVAKVTVFRKDPKAFEAAGDKEFKEGNYKKSIEYYRAAVAASKNASTALLKSGDALNMMVADDPQNLYAARGEWSHALAGDPKFEPALQRLLDSYWEHMEVNPYEVDYARMRETAARLAEVRPGDVKSLAKSYIATLRPWLDGTPAKQSDVKDANTALQNLIARDPSDAEIRYYVARYKLKDSSEKLVRGDRRDADNEAREAATVFDDAMRDPPKDPAANALMQIRAFDIYSRLDRMEKVRAAEIERRKSTGVIVVDPGTGPVPGVDDKGAAPAGSADYAAKAQKALAAAIEAAKSLPVDGNLYFDIQVQAADKATRDKRFADAEKICEDLLAKRPDDQKTRLVYARVLAMTPAKRDKAIEVLSRDVKVERMTGPRGLEALQRRVETLLEMIGMKIDQGRALNAAVAQSAEAATTTAKQRQELVAEIRSDMQRLEPLVPGEMVPVLRLKARLLQLEGKPADAIQTYQRAVTLMEGSPAERKDYDLINELAVAYLQAGQTGSAKKLLEQIIRQYDWYVPARLQMAQLLMNENKLPEAKGQMREAEKQLAKMPTDSQDFQRVRAEFDRTGLMLMNLDKDPRLNQSYTNLPEGTRTEKLNKAAVARQIGKNDEAARLAGAAVKEDPKDLAALESLLGALLSMDRRKEALAALDAAIAANPDRAARLQPAREKLAAAVELSNATPQQVYERRKELLLKEPESVARSIKLADLEREYKHVDDAEKILLDLHSKSPDEVQVVTRLFDLNMNRADWAKAKGYLDKLVAANADEANGLLYQYRMAMSQNNQTEGLRLAKALVAARPEFDVSWVAYGQALQAQRRYGEAIKQYQNARQRKPLNLDAMRGIIECYTAQNQAEPAREALSEARALFPNDNVFRGLELQYQLSYGDPMAAVTQLEQMLKDHPEDVRNWVDLAEAYRNAAQTRPDAEKTALRAKARDVLQRGAARWDADARVVDVRFVKALAEMALDANDAAGGEKLLKDYAARPDRKDRPEGDLLLAEYYARINRPDEAEAGYYAGLKKLTAQAAAETAAGNKDAAAKATSIANDVRVQLSQLLAQRGKFNDALKVLDEGGAADPGIASGDRKLFNQRLLVLIQSNQRDLAEQALLDALAKGGDDLSLQMMLVRVNFDGRRYDEALERVNKVLKADPDSLEAHFFRGQVLLRRPQPDLDAAINDLLLVRKGDPGNAATRILLADAYRLQGDTPKAMRELQEGLANDVTSRDLRLRLMDFRSSEGSKDLNEVLRLTREARNNPQLKDDPIWAVREGRVWTERRDWPKAIAAMEDAARLSPTDVTIVREYQSVLIQAEEFKKVIDQTEKLVRENRAPWWVFMNRAAARNGLKDQAAAMQEFNLALNAAGADNLAVEQIVKVMTTTVGKDKAIEQVMARADKDVRWKLLGAALHSIYKDWDQATKLLDDVQQHFDELPPRLQSQALRISGPLYQLARPPQLDKAKAAYEKLLKMEPNDLFALNNLATLLVDDSLVPNPQQAKVYSQKAFDQVKRAQPFPAAIWDTHGWVLVQCGGGDVDTGIGILQRVVRQTSLPEAHYHLGEAFLKKQDPRKALEELQIAAKSINDAPTNGIAVAPDLEKKIQSATDRAKGMRQADAK